MEGLEIFEHNGAGYNAVMNFESWRVAIANYADKLDEQRFNYVERHMLTDEVFVLLSGEATLVIGKDLTRVKMECGKVYNVKLGVWHALNMTKDAKVLIVENHNTCRDNSEYYYFKD